MASSPPEAAARQAAALRIADGRGSVPVWRAVLDVVGRLGQGDVLDFGGGGGILAWHISKLPAVASVTVVDLVPLNADVAASSVRGVTADLNRPVPLTGGCCDVLVASEIIEHLENPRAVAREWRRLLRPGGWLVMSTPNIECLASMLSFVVRGGFLGFTEPWYPAHITPLSAMDVRHVLSEADFADIATDYTHHGRVPLTSVSWQQLSLGQLRGRRFSDNLVAVARAR